MRFYLKEKQNPACSCFSWVGSFVRLPGRIQPLHCCWEYGRTQKRGAQHAKSGIWKSLVQKLGTSNLQILPSFYFIFTIWLIKCSFNLGGKYFSDNALLLTSTTDQSKCLPRWHDHRDSGHLPRVPIKVEGKLAIRDHDIPAA